MTELNFICSMQSMIFTTFFPASEPSTLSDTCKYYTSMECRTLEDLGKQINRNIFLFSKIGGGFIYKFKSLVDPEYIQSNDLSHTPTAGISQRVLDRLYPCIKINKEVKRQAHIEHVYKSGGTQCIMIECQDGYYRALSYAGNLIFDMSVVTVNTQLIADTIEHNNKISVQVVDSEEVKPSVSSGIIDSLSSFIATTLMSDEPKKTKKLFDTRGVRDRIIEIILSNYSGDREIYVTLMVYLEEFIDFIKMKCTFAYQIMKTGAGQGQIESHFRNSFEKYNKKPDNMFSKIEKKHYVIR